MKIFAKLSLIYIDEQISYPNWEIEVNNKEELHKFLMKFFIKDKLPMPLSQYKIQLDLKYGDNYTTILFNSLKEFYHFVNGIFTAIRLDEVSKNVS